MKEVYVFPPRFNKRLISNLMSSKASNPTESKSFTLKSTREFASRSDQVFEKLQNLEKKHETWVSENDPKEPVEEAKCPIPVQPTPEVFKRPLPVSNRIHKKKNYLHFKCLNRRRKWRKYSLEHVPVSSDATNTATALQFLDELRKRKESPCDQSESSGKVVFNKSFSAHGKEKIEANTFSSGKRSAYNPSCALKRSSPSNEKSSVKLAHLDEDSSD